MAASFRRRGMHAPATFSLFVRYLPSERGFLVAAGLEACLDHLEGLAVDEEDLDALTALGLDQLTVEALAGLRFTGDVWAIPEGRVVFAGEPLLEVTAPIAILLVDTYDTLTGLQRAIDVIADLGLGAHASVRIDSGDLDALARAARRMLDEAGLTDSQVFASGGLDEYAIADLVAAGAPINAYGVGTRMGVSEDAPSLESVYKLVAYADRPVMKLSAGKATTPGAKQVFRGEHGDIIGLRDEPVPDGTEPLLIPVMCGGR